MEKLITIKELTEHLQVSKVTIYNYMKQGMPYKKIGKSTRFELKEVLKYFDGDK